MTASGELPSRAPRPRRRCKQTMTKIDKSIKQTPASESDKPKRVKAKVVRRTIKAPSVGDKIVMERVAIKRNERVVLDFTGKGELDVKSVAFEGGTLQILGKGVTARLAVAAVPAVPQ
jgi:hypothetical protein